MEFHIDKTEVYGINKSIIASGNAMRTEMDSDLIKDFDYWNQFGDFLLKFKNYYFSYNKNKGKNTKDSCAFCGGNTRVEKNRDSGLYLCCKHRHQLERKGRLFETTPEFILLDDKVEIKILKENNKYDSTYISYESLPMVFNNMPSSIKNDGYVKMHDGQALHRFLIDAPEGITVDHIDRNTRNNCLGNLRAISPRENCINASLSKNNTSGIIGVSFRTDKNKYRAYIFVNGKQITLGHYSDFNSAVKARLEGEKEYFGESIAPQRHLFQQYGIPCNLQNENNLNTENHNLLKILNRLKLASNLGNMPRGWGEDNYLNGVIVQFDLYAPLYMWKQIQRYHFMDFVSSQSTMHRLTKFNVASQCVEDTDSVIIERYQSLLEKYNQEENSEEKEKLWRTLVASLPCGFVLGATMTTNYRQLKTIYQQRKNHKLKEWHAFCQWCEDLPLFKELCLGEKE